jgi:regulator of RNase E activity RraB
MREIFSRLEDGSLISIEAETEAHEYKGENPWLFSVFIKYDAVNQSEDKYEEFLETKESLIIALEHNQSAHYAGSRIVDGWSEFYFYASSSKELSSIVSAILAPANYVYESNVVKDTKWSFYELQLCPTELESHHLQSAQIIFLLEEEGDDISVAREVEHYAVFDTSTQKNRFVNSALELGFSFKDDIATDEYEHGVALVKIHMPSEEEVKKNVETLFALIKKERGFYEGWSTTLADKEENN